MKTDETSDRFVPTLVREEPDGSFLAIPGATEGPGFRLFTERNRGEFPPERLIRQVTRKRIARNGGEQ